MTHYSCEKPQITQLTKFNSNEKFINNVSFYIPKATRFPNDSGMGPVNSLSVAIKTSVYYVNEKRLKSSSQ